MIYSQLVKNEERPLMLEFKADDRPRILFISDNLASSFTTLTESLEPEFHLYQAADSAQGIEYLQRNCPDLILCELQKNDITDLIAALKQAEFCSIPLILFTIADQKYKASELLGEGITDYMTRPFEKDELQNRVRTHLFRAKAQKMLQSELKLQNRNISEMVEILIEKNHQLQHENRLKDEFFAVLSHELRNPMNVISGFSEILQDEDVTPEVVKLSSAAIFRSVQVQMKLITDLLEVSKGIAGKIILDCSPMDLKSMVEQALLPFQETALEKNIEVRFISEGSSGTVFGDGIRLSQVFWNLLTNAIKFTPAGGHIEVRLSREDEWIVLSIHDTGSGIDPMFLPQMFEKFHQQDSSTTKHFGGLGLGLAIVRHIVELHSGSVSASSGGIGKGATFTVRLPAMAN